MKGYRTAYLHRELRIHTGLVFGVAGVVFLAFGVALRGVTTSSSSSSLLLSGTSSSEELQNTLRNA